VVQANNREESTLNPSNIKFVLEPLAKHHNLDSFQCENQQLDRYLKLTASQDRKRNIAVPYVAVNLANTQIIGYYTLSMTSIDLGELPQAIAKKLPKYPLIGVTLIGRLAVASNYQGLGWGKLLLMDALYKSFVASKQVASFAVVVDAIDESAVRFYQRFDFRSFPEQPLKLFRTMKNIAQTFK
jgi:ribosomal protein S18 acetylase RimI-like enzyme